MKRNITLPAKMQEESPKCAGVADKTGVWLDRRFQIRLFPRRGGLFTLWLDMKKAVAKVVWVLVALLGAWAYMTLASRRGEPINSAYILVAALCSYAIGYRFYSKWIAARVLSLDDARATP